MSYHGEREFTCMQNDLGSLFAAAAEQYANEQGLERLSKRSLSQMNTPIEAIAGEVLMFGCNAWPETAKEEQAPFEVAPSEVDPPVTERWKLSITLVAVASTIGLGYLFSYYFDTGDYFSISFGILFIGILFGAYHSLFLGLTSNLLHNLIVVPPALAFTWPTEREIVMGVLTMVFALAVPWIAGRAVKERARLLAASPIRAIA